MSSRALSVEENLTRPSASEPAGAALKRQPRPRLRGLSRSSASAGADGGHAVGGQQRLLSLAKVLVVPSKVLVADELSLGLAPVVVDTVYEGLRAINRNGTALLVVEQQIDRVLKLAGRPSCSTTGASPTRARPPARRR